MTSDVSVRISNQVPTRRTRPCHATNAVKWSAVLVVCTVAVYSILIIHKAESYFFSPEFSGEDDIRKSARYNNLAPIQHVYYLKTHKTGSTSIYSILAEYCRSHDLLPLLPTHVHINLSPPFFPSQVMLDFNISKYDMVFNHHVYDETIFNYLHPDTFRFTTLREPFRHFVSSFHYFRDVERFKYLNRINTSDPIATFLAEPHKYEVKGYASFTNNRQSMDLGYNISHSFHDLDYLKTFISLTEKRFHLILITDYFHESLVLLKRTLRWSTTDILYYRKLTNKRIMNWSSNLQDLYRRQHQSFSTADIELYKHFLPVFKHRISRERGLAGEVQEFEAVLSLVHSFCARKQPRSNPLLIPAGRWCDQVHLVYSKCKWLKLDEVSFTRQVQQMRRLFFTERSTVRATQH